MFYRNNATLSIFKSVFCMDEAVSQRKVWSGGCPGSHWARGRDTHRTSQDTLPSLTSQFTVLTQATVLDFGLFRGSWKAQRRARQPLGEDVDST